MVNTQAQFPSKSIQAATYAVRLSTFIAALAMFGTLFMPWIQLDGHDTPYSGAELLTLIASPEFAYLNTVSPIQSLILVGGPFIIFIAIAVAATKKFHRETSPVSAALILTVAVVVAYVPTTLTHPESERFYSGSLALMAIAAILLAQDIIVIIRDRFKLHQRAPAVDNILAVVSASGRYEMAW